MTLIPPGAQLAPVDLPPPPPSADPREPSSTPLRGRGASTPRKLHSPQPSRGSSPVRPGVGRNPSSDHSPLSSPPKASSPPLHAPIPRPLRASQSAGVPIGAGGIGSILASGNNSSSIPTPHHNPLHPHHSRPSSPASIHSSASAIFERDIELPAVASLSLNPNSTTPHTLSHKPSRLTHPTHGSALDHTVPAVLDDAVEALTASEGQSRGFGGLEIEAPAPITSIGMARQSSSSIPVVGGSGNRRFSPGQTGGTGSSISRSPSPISVGSAHSPITSPANSPPILSQLASHGVGRDKSPTPTQPQTTVPLNGTTDNVSVPRPALGTRMSTGPILPGGWAFGYGNNTATKDEKPSSPPPQAEAAIPTGTAQTIDDASSATSVPPPPGDGPASLNAIPSHLVPVKDKRRISFISYNDLLLSVPTTVTHLSEITSGQLSPDHLPGTISPNMGLTARSPMLGGQGGVIDNVPNSAGLTGSMGHRPSWEGRGGPGNSGIGLGVGVGVGVGEGEWEREGLGKGLEQRLEDLAIAKDQSQSQSQTQSQPLAMSTDTRAQA